MENRGLFRRIKNALETKAWRIKVRIRDRNRTFPETSKPCSYCILGNAHPKCGTYLLYEIIDYLKTCENIGIHIFDKHYMIFNDYKIIPKNPRVYWTSERILRNMKNGQFAVAHLPYKKSLAKIIGEPAPQRRLKHLFIYRHPFDAVVSFMKFTTYNKNYAVDDVTVRFQAYMQGNFKNDDDRLSYVIDLLLLKGSFNEYYGWIEDPATCTLKFEDLYDETCALDTSGFGESYSRIFAYLGIDPAGLVPAELQEKVLNKGYTATQKKNKFGQYKECFKPEHYRLIEESRFEKTLKRYGYEI